MWKVRRAIWCYNLSMPLLWNDDFSIGVKIIDEQHKQFITVLSELIDSVGKPESDEEIEKVFSGIDKYLTLHFKTEEKYFKEFNYKGAKEHIKDHVSFKKKIAGIKQEYKKDKILSSFNLANFLEDWLVTHINGMDRKYVLCFHEHGLY